MPGGSKKGGGLEVKKSSFYKMKGSPMKRNFGISPLRDTNPHTGDEGHTHEGTSTPENTFTFGGKSYNLKSKVVASQPAGDDVYMALSDYEKEGGKLSDYQRSIMKERSLAVQKNYWDRYSAGRQ